MARGVDRRPIFVDDEDRAGFLERLRRIEGETGARVVAYCLMGNHFHFAIQVGPVPLAMVMQRLLAGYAMRFNRRHERTGHLFEARYKANVCLDDRYLLGLINYIHMNPVRAGLVSSPKDWPWSSYVPGAASDDGFTDFDPWPKPEQVRLARSATPGIADLEAIGSSVSARTAIDLVILRSTLREPAAVEARRVFVQEAVRNGHALKSAAKWLNVSRRSASRYAHESYGQTAGLTPKVDIS